MTNADVISAVLRTVFVAACAAAFAGALLILLRRHRRLHDKPGLHMLVTGLALVAFAALAAVIFMTAGCASAPAAGYQRPADFEIPAAGCDLYEYQPGFVGPPSGRGCVVHATNVIDLT